jgi:hypothetical protein
LSTGYECDCPLGKAGKFCERGKMLHTMTLASAYSSINNIYFKFHKYFCFISDETLSDVAFSGTRSYLSLPPVELHHQETSIDIEVRPLYDRGLLLFVGHQDGNSFLSLSLQGGVLELRVAPGIEFHNFCVEYQ